MSANETNDYRDLIMGGGIQDLARESKEKAQKLEDARVRREQERISKMNLEANERAAAEAEAKAEKKRAAMQAELDAAAKAQADEQKMRAKREYRSVMGSLEGFETWYASHAANLVDEKIRERMSRVADPRTYARGDFTGFGGGFTPMDFPR